METIRCKGLRAFALALFALVSVAGASAQQLSTQLQNAVGHWQVINDDGKPRGHVDTYLVDGKLFGKVTQVRPGRNPKDLCDKCSGQLKNQTHRGMVIMRNFHPDGELGWRIRGRSGERQGIQGKDYGSGL